MKLKMLGDRIAVKPHGNDKMLGNIHLPDIYAKLNLRGTVVACGPGHTLPNGKVVPLQVKVGDVVHYGFGGQEVKVDGEAEPFLVFHEEGILAVIE